MTESFPLALVKTTIHTSSYRQGTHVNVEHATSNKGYFPAVYMPKIGVEFVEEVEL